MNIVDTADGLGYKVVYNIDYSETAKVFYFRILVDGVASDAVLAYSVEAYLNDMSSTMDNNFYYFIVSLVCFGRVTAQYNAA